MKKTQVLELFKNIKSTFMSFFSIMMFVALSVGIFVGISWTGPALQRSAEQVFDSGAFHDFEIQFPYGLSDENLAELRGLDGVADVETAYASFQAMDRHHREYVAKVMSVTEEIDIPTATEGRLPEQPGEIALNTDWAQGQKLKVGDTIRFKHDAGKKDADGMKYLKYDTYTITGFVDSPAYIAKSTASFGFSNIGTGNIQCLAYVAPESFDQSAYNGAPIALLRSDALRVGATESDAYRTQSAALNDLLNELGEKRAAERCQAIRDKAQKKIDDGARKIAKAERQIADAEQQIKDGERQLAAGKAQVAAGEQALRNAKRQLDNYQAKLDKASAAFADLEGVQPILGNGIDALKASPELTAAQKNSREPLGDLSSLEAYDDGIVALTQARMTDIGRTLRSYGYPGWQERCDLIFGAKAEGGHGGSVYLSDLIFFRDYIQYLGDEIDKYQTQLADGWAQYREGQKQLEEGKRKVAEGEALLAQKKQELADAKAQLAAAKEKLEALKAQLAAMKDYQWTVLSREGNGGVQALMKFSDVTNKLRYSMAMLFVIIGLLVSYSAISRIVRDQFVSIGTKKALGLRRREVTLSYLCYSGIAVLTGAVIGLIMGVFGIEPFLAKILGARFVMGPYDPLFSPGQALLVICVELGLILLTAWFACGSVMRENAVELLKGAKPPAGKPRFFESWKAWERLPLFSKTIVNNCLNDKRRVLGTIIGVAGCTALLVTAMTLNSNVQNSFTKQYEDVYHYDAVVRYDSATAHVQENIDQKLSQAGMAGTPVYTSSYVLNQPDGKNNVVTVTVPFDEDAFGDYLTITPKGETAEESYADGAWVSYAYASHLDAEPGDKIQLLDSEGQPHAFTIQGFFPHYLLNNQIITTQAGYRAAFGTACKANAILTDSGGQGAKAVKQALADVDGIRTVKDDYGWSRSIFEEFSQITSAVITIYLVLSVLMAIVVLLDLNAVFIEEKKRELIILMINGFSVQKAKRYIYRDTIVLTVIGILLGLVVGTLMGNITVMSVEPVNASFIKGISWTACAVGAGVSAVLAIAMCLISLRRVSHFKLADINKM